MIMAQIGASWCTLSIVIHGSGAADVDVDEGGVEKVELVALSYPCILLYVS